MAGLQIYHCYACKKAFFDGGRRDRHFTESHSRNAAESSSKHTETTNTKLRVSSSLWGAKVSKRSSCHATTNMPTPLVAENTDATRNKDHSKHKSCSSSLKVIKNSQWRFILRNLKHVWPPDVTADDLEEFERAKLEQRGVNRLRKMLKGKNYNTLKHASVDFVGILNQSFCESSYLSHYVLRNIQRKTGISRIGISLWFKWKREKRGLLSPKQILVSTFNESQYPCSEELVRIAEATGLDKSRVESWFRVSRALSNIFDPVRADKEEMILWRMFVKCCNGVSNHEVELMSYLLAMEKSHVYKIFLSWCLRYEVTNNMSENFVSNFGSRRKSMSHSRRKKSAQKNTAHGKRSSVLIDKYKPLLPNDNELAMLDDEPYLPDQPHSFVRESHRSSSDSASCHDDEIPCSSASVPLSTCNQSVHGVSSFKKETLNCENKMSNCNEDSDSESREFVTTVEGINNEKDDIRGLQRLPHKALHSYDCNNECDMYREQSTIAVGGASVTKATNEELSNHDLVLRALKKLRHKQRRKGIPSKACISHVNIRKGQIFRDEIRARKQCKHLGSLLTQNLPHRPFIPKKRKFDNDVEFVRAFKMKKPSYSHEPEPLIRELQKTKPANQLKLVQETRNETKNTEQSSSAEEALFELIQDEVWPEAATQVSQHVCSDPASSDTDLDGTTQPEQCITISDDTSNFTIEANEQVKLDTLTPLLELFPIKCEATQTQLINH